jgi:mannose-6-phosphate isomerase-like protein (cupin superfamily)
MDSDVNVAAVEWETGERFVSLRRALGVTSFGLNQITLQPGQRGRIHRHREQEEVYLVLRGSLTVAFENEEVELAEGQAIRVGPPTRRQLLNRGDRPCVVVAIGGAGEHVGRDGEAFAAWSDTQGRPPQDVPLPADLPSDDNQG